MFITFDNFYIDSLWSLNQSHHATILFYLLGSISMRTFGLHFNIIYYIYTIKQSQKKQWKKRSKEVNQTHTHKKEIMLTSHRRFKSINTRILGLLQFHSVSFFLIWIDYSNNFEEKKLQFLMYSLLVLSSKTCPKSFLMRKRKHQ